MKTLQIKSKIIVSFTALLTAMPAAAQNDDPVVMTIAGQPVNRSEFEYALNKNNNGQKVTDPAKIAEYAEIYANYKLKVKAGSDASLDTTKSFLKEYNQYRTVQLRPYLIDEEYMDSMALDFYNRTVRSLHGQDIFLSSHILIKVSQKESDAKAKARIDAVYKKLKQGADFAEMAKEYSEDLASKNNGGELPWMGPDNTLPEVVKVAYSLKPGEMSEPFLSTAGYHILLLKGFKKFGSYTEKKPEIVNILKKHGVDNEAQERKIEKMMNDGQGLSRDQVIDKVQAEAVAGNMDLRNLLREYHDGLLMYEACDKMVWAPAAADKDALAKYFDKNKAKYQWAEPHFRGFVILSHKAENLPKAVDIVRQFKDNNGVKAVRRAMFREYNRHGVIVRFGVYEAGENPYVDHKQFGKGVPKKSKSYPYYEVVGQKISKPELYTDVEAQVVSDYQDQCEKEWLEGLKKKYKVKVDKSVLATVNKH